mmetsp:Transcript_12331/g.33646  ORF Transcript_12331/g.33646 Transcript_12331/m.33646 type:complete len:548 (+) Transcript_12331:1301-2944(+)
MLHAALLSHHPFASPPHTQHSLPHSSAPNYCSGRGSSTTPSVLNRTDGHAQVLCSHLMLASITAYNALADLLPLLPCAAAAGTPDAAQHEATLRSLPSMLRCTWHGSLPRCVSMEDEASPVGDHHRSSCKATLAAEARSSDWVAKRAGQIWEDLGIMQGLEVVDLISKAEDLAPAAAAQERERAQVRLAGAGERQGKQAAAARTPPLTTTTATTAAVTGPSLPQTSSTLKGLNAGPQDMGTKVDRQSFYDLIGSKSQRGQPRSSAAQPSAPLGIIDDRAARKRQQRQQLEQRQRQQQEVSDAGNQNVAKEEPPQGTVPVVYSTAFSGFTLGLGASKKVMQQQQPGLQEQQQQQQQPQEAKEPDAPHSETHPAPQPQLQQQQQQQPSAAHEPSVAHSPPPPPQLQPPLPPQQKQQQQQQPSSSLPALQQPQLPTPAFLRVGSVAQSNQPKQGQPPSIGGDCADVPAKETVGVKRGREDAQGSGLTAPQQPQLSLLDALSNKKRKKAKPQPPVENEVEKPKAWDDLLPANLLQGNQGGKNKKKKNMAML